MNLREEFDKTIKAISPYHYRQQKLVYYCPQEHYDLLEKNDFLYILNDYKIVILPALLDPKEYYVLE